MPKPSRRTLGSGSKGMPVLASTHRRNAYVATAATGIFLASKNGDISAAKLISETPKLWVLETEKRVVRVSKGDTRLHAFREMTDSLQWAEADPKLIEHFSQLMAAKAAPGNQH